MYPDNITSNSEYSTEGLRQKPPSARDIKKILIILYLVVVAFAAWQIIPAIHTKKNTGVLDIKTSSSNAQLSISEENHQAVLIGTASAQVRLTPGIYQVAATAKGLYATIVVTVKDGHTTHSYLNTSSNSKSNVNTQKARTVADVSFQGTNDLINNGLSSEQASEMEQYFFQFKPSAKKVDIDTSTVEPGPHNPNTINPFTLNFKVNVDKTSYNATVSYLNLNNVKLQLFNPKTGKQTFSAGTVGNP